MATASLSIDRTDLTLSELVFSGQNGSSFGLLSLALPAMVPRLAYASPARWLHGSTPVSAAWEHTNLSATVIFEADTAADLLAAKQEALTALARLTYTVTTEQNGTEQTWAADWGSLAPASDLDLVNLTRLFEVHRLVIPVHPLEVP